MAIGPDPRDLAAKRALASGGFRQPTDEELLSQGVDPREIKMRNALKARLHRDDTADVATGSAYDGAQSPNPWNMTRDNRDPRAQDRAAAIPPRDPRAVDRLQAKTDAAMAIAGATGPVSPEVEARAAQLGAQGRRIGNAQSRQMQFGNTGVGLADANPQGARSTPAGQHPLDAEAAAAARARARAMALATPSAPMPDAVGAGSKAQFYAGQPGGALFSQLGGADADGMREARWTMAGANDNQPYTEINPSGGGKNDARSMALRAQSLRNDPAYQQAVEARRQANRASASGASPKSVELPPVMIGTNSMPAPLQVSPEQRKAIDARAAQRSAKAEAAQGKVNDFAMNKRAARQARMTGLNPQVTSPSMRDFYGQQEDLMNIQGRAAVDAARYGQDGSEAFKANAAGQALQRLDLKDPDQRKLYMELFNRMYGGDGGGPGRPGLGAAPPAGVPAPVQGSAAERYQGAQEYFSKLPADLSSRMIQEAIHVYGQDAVDAALKNRRTWAQWFGDLWNDASQGMKQADVEYGAGGF